LGQDHDLEMLAHHVSGRDGPKLTVRQREHVLSGIEARQTMLRADARRLGQQLFADAPGSFGETVAFHWATARESTSNMAAEAAAAE
ncbi:MAG: hypothetical protein K2Y05_03230, partial [Hyphomicrobiaceae bacterium]|nr:hypothetical protein [Hyphomicrobiaceae bacterium]